MDKSEALKVFISDFVKIRSAYYFKDIMEYYIENREEIIMEFCQSFIKLCKNIHNLTAEIPSVYYIQFSMMLNRILQEKSAYLVEAFGENYFLEPPIAESIYDPRWLTGRLLMFYEEMKQEAKRYMFGISEIEVERLFLAEVKYYEKLMDMMAAESAVPIHDSEEYQNLQCEESIEFRIGEFRGASKLLFVKSEEYDQLWSRINELLLNQTG